MRSWDAEALAAAAGARLVSKRAASRPSGGPIRACIDSRAVRADELFVGLRGERTDGGAHAEQALAAGAWGVLVSPEHIPAATRAARGGAVVLEHPQPLLALHALARAWRAELGGRGAKVVAITGSTGKTSTKDILAALLAGALRTSASRENLNTEIGLPLAVLEAPADTEALVLEMAMRGAGQIAELTAIAEPDVGVLVNVGPAHLELLGSLEAIAAAKAELLEGLEPGRVAVVPAGEPLLAPHIREDVHTITFGEHGDVRLLERRPSGELLISDRGHELSLTPSFSQAHNLRNLLAAVAAARALGVEPGGALEVRFSSLRGQRVGLGGGAVAINDCYNANPMSMRAAIDELAETAVARRVAVLGDMLELGESAPEEHREVGRYASSRGVAVLITVGELGALIGETFVGELHSVTDADAAVAALSRLLRSDDTVLVKGSRGVGLERVAQALAEDAPGARDDTGFLAPAAGAVDEKR